MSFITGRLTLTESARISVISGLTQFDYSALTATNFAFLFGQIQFDQSVTDLATSAEFGGITLVINILNVFILEGQSIEVVNGFGAGLGTYISENNFWSKTSVSFNDMLSLASSTGADATVIQNVIATASASIVEFDAAAEIAIVQGGFNVFQADF